MDHDAPLCLFLPREEATTALGGWFAAHLQAGDTLLLSGPIGAGKSHFARAFIRARLGRQEDVPSPSFTLVQTYQADVEIWHSDLYRLSHPDEVFELGLDDAFSTAICLVEWPDRLGKFVPKQAISISFASEAEGRMAEIRFAERVDLRAALLQDWLR
jgi:tRNA threonylcarbamoyladenosine biosynthesis protein TsaE